MPIVEMPNGDRVQFPDDMPKEQIRDMIASKFPELKQEQQAPEAPDMVDEAKSNRDKMYGDGMLGGIAKSIGAASDMVGSGLTFGFDDEISAGLSTGFGFLGDYGEAQKRFEARKKATREQNPVASTVGELAGGLTTGGGLAKGGLTLAGKSLPVIGRTGAAALEGAAYGGLYGAGEAGQGERLQGAATGAAIGGVTGGLVSKAGDKIATAMARKAANTVAPTVDDIGAQSSKLYEGMRNSGMVVKAKPLENMRNNIKLTMKGTTPELAPQSANLAGFVDDRLAQDTNILDLHNISKTVNRKVRELRPGSEDHYYASKIKDFVDGTIERLSPSDVTGANPQAIVGMKKQADRLWGLKKKTELIESILESAEDRAGQYSQSGMANAIKTEMRQLARQIRKGKVKGFTPEEIKLIKRMAAGGSSSMMINWLSKFAPRGAVSFLANVGAGAAMGGPVTSLGLAGAGMGAAKIADNGAIQAAQALRTSAATGANPLPAAVTNKTVPFIGAISGQSASLPRR